VETLEADDLFAEANVTALLDIGDENWREDASKLYRRLSSGHAIVLLSITRLVELVDERTLVLLDEPESHLHPPLLAAFVRALSDLLIKRNGVAIIATHSPVVLQEVPRSCAWKLRRSGRIAVTERPTIETFGENVGVLTREVFGYEVTKSGFHRMLHEAVSRRGLDFDGVVAHFDGQLGAEARAIVRALVAERETSQ
jgi:ABC-type multidrug transport system ATPase subunit